MKVLGLVPTIAQTYSLASIKDVFKADLPSPQLLSTDWKIRCTSIPLTLQAALQYCDKDAFPNIYVLLVIACCESGRFNSQLKLLKTYTMTNERLSALAVTKCIAVWLKTSTFVLTFADESTVRTVRVECQSRNVSLCMTVMSV